MHRQPLLDMLKQYVLQHPDEADVAERIGQLVTNSPECFERHCRPGHITASAWVLSHDQNHCVLVHHRKLGRWLQPGGHADSDSDVVAVARREVEEETGLLELELVLSQPFDIDVHRIPSRVDSAGSLIEDAHDHHDLRFLFRAAADQQLILSEESNDIRWFSCQEVLEVTGEESVLRMLRKAGPEANDE
ncbi:MAG: NUDIX domain-containing protein [Planctomycetes bacterium]|nr:NUDIX domain-containing protein [Planctomycetota bacterium]